MFVEFKYNHSGRYR